MTIFKGERATNLYRMMGNFVVGDVSVTTKKEDTARLWALTYASWNISERDLQHFHKKGALLGLKYCKLNLCEFCIFEKRRRLAFSTSQHMSKELLDLVRTDV